MWPNWCQGSLSPASCEYLGAAVIASRHVFTANAVLGVYKGDAQAHWRARGEQCPRATFFLLNGHAGKLEFQFDTEQIRNYSC